MKRIALVFTLAGSPALAEITPLDVIESWRTVYAGLGEAITYDSVQAGANGKGLLLNNLTSVGTLANITTTSRFDWVLLTPDGEGGIMISFSPLGEKVDVAKVADGGEDITSAQFDFSALSLLATGYPSDIRYRYSAPQLTYSEHSGDEDFGTQLEVAITDFSGEATSITNVTESGPQVADGGDFSFGRMELMEESYSIIAEPVVVRVVAQNAGLSYNWSFPLTDIPLASVPLTDFPPQADLVVELTTGQVVGVQTEDSGLGLRTINFGQENGTFSAQIAHGQFRFGMTSENGNFGVIAPMQGQPSFDITLASLQTHLTMPFRKTAAAAPFSASFTVNGFALDPEIWAEFDPANSMGQPALDISISVSGLMQLLFGMFEDTSDLPAGKAPFFVPDLTLETLRLAAGGAVIEGQGDLRFNRGRMDPDTDLPEAKGALDISIIGALGFLDRFGRLTDVDPMAILSMKGGLGMFARPTDTPDSFTSKIEFLFGGGIVINGQTVR